MKQFYSLTTTVLALFFFSFSLSAQPYTAVRSGNWHVASGVNVWDPNGEPPSQCLNCIITIQDGVSVAMNADITLMGTSKLTIGTDPSSTQMTQLTFPFSSSTPPPTPFPIPSAYHRISLVYADLASIVLTNSNDKIDPSSTGPYDGVFLAIPTPQSVNTYAYLQRLGTSALYPNAADITSGPLTLNSSGILPIILSSFTAASDNKVVDLNWTTSLEINSNNFVIERSTDAGAHWNVLGTVAAHGSSSGLSADYSFTDATPAAGTNEYRLQLVDRDGKYSYSTVKAVRMGLISSVSIYPNPARDYVNVTLSGTVTPSVSIRLISQSGQLLMEKRVDNAAGTTVSLPVGSYPQGNYLILVTGTDGVQQVSKLLISKQ
jgi:Secretion system C-terminal sorting domain